MRNAVRFVFPPLCCTYIYIFWIITNHDTIFLCFVLIFISICVNNYYNFFPSEYVKLCVPQLYDVPGTLICLMHSMLQDNMYILIIISGDPVRTVCLPVLAVTCRRNDLVNAYLVR